MDWKRVWAGVKRWLFPGWGITLLLAAAGGALLALVFVRRLEETPLAYGAYLLSAYALTALVGAVARSWRPVWDRICALPLAERWLADPRFRVRIGLLLSFFINLCYAGMRMVYGAVYASGWEVAVGIYYLLLSVLRFYLMRKVSPGGGRYREELRVYRVTGWLLMGLNLALTGVSAQIVLDGRGYDYPGTLIYAAAAYSFYSLTIAIINVVKYRKFHSPVLSAAKAVGLTCALMSIFSLETAMLAQFGGETRFQQLMTAGTAVAVCAIVLAMAAYMVVSAGRKLKKG